MKRGNKFLTGENSSNNMNCNRGSLALCDWLSSTMLDGHRMDYLYCPPRSTCISHSSRQSPDHNSYLVKSITSNRDRVGVSPCQDFMFLTICLYVRDIVPKFKINTWHTGKSADHYRCIFIAYTSATQPKFRKKTKGLKIKPKK